MSETAGTREIILNILMDMSESGQPVYDALSSWLLKYQYLDRQDRRLISSVVRTTLEREVWIDAVINKYSSVRVKKMKPVIRTILRMSTCQILFMEGVADHAACNEAVKLAVRRGFKGLKGFVNGVLRTIARNKDSAFDVLPDVKTQPEAYLSMRYSTPEWLIHMWCASYGFEQTERMLESFEGRRVTTIRVNTLKTDPQTLKEKLEKQNISVEEGAYLPYILKISGYDYLDAIDSFRNGEFYVQDESSALAGAVAGFKPGMSVIDLCGAPGGKSINAALLMQDQGHIDTRDLTQVKAERIEENVRRLGISCIDVAVQDALEDKPEDEASADVVIADLPCSGLGVIGRKADIKYHMTPDAMEALRKLQSDILDVCWRYVKPGGVLMYSTCTVNDAENIDQVRAFMSTHPFHMESLDESIPESLRSPSTKEGWLQILPGMGGCDGFFMAKLRRDDV